MAKKTYGAQAFLDKFGDEEAEQVCLLAGTSLVYFKQCCEGRRTPSRKLAEKLEIASGGRLSRAKLVWPDLAMAA